MAPDPSHQSTGLFSAPTGEPVPVNNYAKHHLIPPPLFPSISDYRLPLISSLAIYYNNQLIYIS